MSMLGRRYNRGFRIKTPLKIWGLTDQGGCGGFCWNTLGDNLSRLVGQHTCGHSEVLVNYGSWGQSCCSGCGRVRAWLGDRGDGSTLQLTPGGQRRLRVRLDRTAYDSL